MNSLSNSVFFKKNLYKGKCMGALNRGGYKINKALK